ncbi:MAG: hypothetical protein AAGA41_02125 [Pseudomonadota bacterium]
MSLLAEFKRRNVFRVTAAYAVAAWAVAEVADLAFETFGAPDWAMRALLVVLLLGLPLAAVFAWIFELAPDGLRVDHGEGVPAEQQQRIRRRLNIVIGIGAAIGLTILGATFLLKEDDAASDNTAQRIANAATQDRVRPSIAVLPFEDQSPDGDQRHLADGIPTELLTALRGIDSIRVVSRTSSFAFRDSGMRSPEIAELLDVDHIVEGAVQRTAGRVRIQAALINVRTDETLWSDSYTEPARDAFALQDDITRRIAAALRVTIGEDGEARIEQVFSATDNEAAYDKFLLGEHLWHLRGEDNIREAIGHLEDAIEMEPNFGRAQALLSMAHITLQSYAFVDSLEEWEALRDTNVAAARGYAERALAIDPTLVDPYTALGDLTRVENRWQDAETYYLRALELDPDNATANLWYGEFLEDVGRTNEAYSATRKTLDVDPFSPGANAMLAGLLMADEECEALAEPADRATTLGHDFGEFSRMLCDMSIGDWQSAAARAESTLPDEAPPDAVELTESLKALGAATTEAQSAEAAQRVLAFLSEFAGGDAAASVALMHLGFTDEVVEMLIEESASWGGLSRVFWGVASEELRAHPRFGELLELSGLAEYYRTTGILPDPCTTEPAEAFCSTLGAT